MPASPTTSTSHRLSRHLALACASLLTIAPLTADDVIVHSDTIQEINGVSAIPDGLFGITAYDGAATSTDSPWLPILRRSGIRWAGLPGDSRWVFAKDAHPAAGWADSPEALNRLDHPLGGYAIPQCLRAWRDLGIEPMLYLLGYPDSLNGGMATAGKPSITDFPKDPLAAGEMWAEYVALMRRADPQLTWLHLGNEPNASWFQQGHDGREWATIFRAVATAVRERNPGVKIGGPTLCWPLSWPPAQAGSASWYTWKQWAEPLIAQVGDQLDFVDFHLYDASASVGVEEVQTIVNALWLSTGKRIPVMISEYGVYLKPEDIASPARVWRRRVASWQEQVMAFLDLQPDLLLSLQPHDLFADAGGKFTFLKGTDPADQHALARVYRVWAPFRGTRLATSAAQSAVRAFAAVARDDLTGSRRMSIVLVNTSSAAQEIGLRLDGPMAPAGLVLERFARLVEPDAHLSLERHLPEGFQDAAAGGVNGGSALAPAASPTPPTAGPPSSDRSRIESGEMVADRLPDQLELAGDEVRCLSFPIAASTPPPSRCRWERTLFGDVIHRDFTADQPAITVHVPLTPESLSGADGASLQVGLLGARDGDSVTIAIDGQTATVRPDWHSRIRLGRVPVPHDGMATAVITLVQRGHPDDAPKLLRLGSLVLALTGESAQTTPPPADAPSGTAPSRFSWSIPGAIPPSPQENPWSGAVQVLPGLAVTDGLIPIAPPLEHLTAACTAGVQSSPAQALLFRAPQSGWYRVHASGQLTRFSSPSAGHAALTIALLGFNADAMRPLATLPLNLPGGFGNYPQQSDWSQTLRLTAGWRIAFALQAVSPGPANAGSATWTWSRVQIDYIGSGGLAHRTANR